MRKALANLAVVMLAYCAFATTVVPMSVERVTQASTHVLEGRAAESWSAWNPQHTQIFTYTRFRVYRALKGRAASEVIVKQMGGRAGGFEQKVAGVRQLQSGEEAVLFVHPSQAADGTFVITGLMQGNFRVMSEGAARVVSNGVEGVNQFKRGSSSVEHFSGSRMPLSQLEAIVAATSAPKETK